MEKINPAHQQQLRTQVQNNNNNNSSNSTVTCGSREENHAVVAMNSNNQQGRKEFASILSFDSCSIPDDQNIIDLIKNHRPELRFPEKLMLLIKHVERDCANNSHHVACIGWTRDGRALIIRNVQELVHDILPLVFPQPGKFSSFTRKLYRWGFRQVLPKGTTTTKSDNNKDDDNIESGGGVDVKCFAHVYFQRDNMKLMSKMESITAEGRRAKKRPVSNATESTPLEHIMYQSSTDTGSPTISGASSLAATVPAATLLRHQTTTSLLGRLAVQELMMRRQRDVCGPLQEGGFTNLTSLVRTPSFLQRSEKGQAGLVVPSSLLSHNTPTWMPSTSVIAANHQHLLPPISYFSIEPNSLSPLFRQTAMAAAITQQSHHMIENAATRATQCNVGLTGDEHIGEYLRVVPPLSDHNACHGTDDSRRVPCVKHVTSPTKKKPRSGKAKPR